MDKSEFRAARKALGWSTARTARELRLGETSGRTVRRWEAGEYPVPGPVAVAMEAFRAGFVRTAGVVLMSGPAMPEEPGARGTIFKLDRPGEPERVYYSDGRAWLPYMPPATPIAAE